MAEPQQPWTSEQLQSDDITKKDLVTFLKENANNTFQVEHKLKGNIKNVCKTKSKDQLIADYNKLFETKAFKIEGEEEENDGEQKKVDQVVEKAEKLSVKGNKDMPPEPPKYTKRVLSKGSSKNKPIKGDTVACHYTGTLEDGTVFDSSLPQGKKLNDKSRHRAQPLKFKVGMGKVIRGWDEVLMTMCIGEKAKVIIEPEWAYGKKGVEGKIPSNSRLHFEIELVNIE